MHDSILRLAAATFIGIAISTLSGCGTQSYEVLTRETPITADAKRYVVDVTVIESERREDVDLIFGESVKRSAQLRVDRVIRGSDVPAVLQLNNYRELSPAERELFPTRLGIALGTRMRLR